MFNKVTEDFQENFTSDISFWSDRMFPFAGNASGWDVLALLVASSRTLENKPGTSIFAISGDNDRLSHV